MRLLLISGIGLVILFILTGIVLTEGFADAQDAQTVALSLSDISKFPEPHKVFSQLRSLIDKYDSPDVWNHATQMIDKDPGELARRQLGILNKA